MPTERSSDPQVKLEHPSTHSPSAAAAATPSNGGGDGPLRLQPGCRPLPDFELVRKLGAGGFGEVWHARAAGGIDVALKFIRLDAGGSHLELRSLEMMKSIRHPNLVSLFGAWHKDGMLIMAMELCDGTLQDRLNKARAQSLSGLPVGELLNYLHDAARGIDLLNDKQVQHRDIKPLNLLLLQDGVKVADFGLAKILQCSVGSNTGSMTPHYAAPECFMGQIAHQSDQYSLAITYCQLRTGQLPFDGSIERVMYGHLHGQPDLSKLPPAEQAVVARALAKVPAQRYSTCQAFAQALAVASGQLHLLATPTLQNELRTTRDLPLPAARRMSGPVAAGLLALMLLSCGGVLLTGLALGLHFFGGDLAPDRAVVETPKTVTPPPPLQPEGIVPKSDEPKKAADQPKSDEPKKAADQPKPAEPLKSAEKTEKAKPPQPSPEPKKPAADKFKDLPGTLTVEVGQRVSIEFVLVRAGKFQMGSPAGELERNPWKPDFDAEQEHEVEITKPFYLAKYLTTQEQYQTVAAANPSYFFVGGQGAKFVQGLDTAKFPVESVSWLDAREFCAQLTKFDKQGRKFGLPTEAQWEYACRAGTKTPFHFGDVCNGDEANCHGYYSYGTNVKGPYLDRTSAVGSYPANAWGLFDMHGNVWQWCEDFYGPATGLGIQDPLRTMLDKEEKHVVRGGSWRLGCGNCRAAVRVGFAPAYRDNNTGFRVCLRLE